MLYLGTPPRMTAFKFCAITCLSLTWQVDRIHQSECLFKIVLLTITCTSSLWRSITSHHCRPECSYLFHLKALNASFQILCHNALEPDMTGR